MITARNHSTSADLLRVREESAATVVCLMSENSLGFPPVYVSRRVQHEVGANASAGLPTASNLSVCSHSLKAMKWSSEFLTSEESMTAAGDSTCTSPIWLALCLYMSHSCTGVDYLLAKNRSRDVWVRQTRRLFRPPRNMPSGDVIVGAEVKKPSWIRHSPPNSIPSTGVDTIYYS